MIRNRHPTLPINDVTHLYVHDSIATQCHRLLYGRCCITGNIGSYSLLTLVVTFVYRRKQENDNLSYSVEEIIRRSFEQRVLYFREDAEVN